VLILPNTVIRLFLTTRFSFQCTLYAVTYFLNVSWCAQSPPEKKGVDL